MFKIKAKDWMLTVSDARTTLYRREGQYANMNGYAAFRTASIQSVVISGNQTSVVVLVRSDDSPIRLEFPDEKLAALCVERIAAAVFDSVYPSDVDLTQTQ